ncbi:MAG: ABC transporter ATP-binding protein [Spirochaetes bacterium]|nr:ABC transporter ATP-binding protein [Spirochaetota bacterium]MBP8991435.1 ABC transporter ATP-binding protein [Spirochaetota bacterium]
MFLNNIDLNGVLNLSDAIIVENLSKRFGKHLIIDNLSFKIAQDDTVALFAPSGSGKTTLLSILANLDKNYTGSFYIKKPYSIVFQEARLFPYKSAYENIIYPLKLNDIDIDENVSDNIKKWLDICDLKDFSNYYPYQLSGGMKAKIALIRAFIFNPSVILLDEPFKSIDVQSKNKIIKFIKKEYKNLTILLVTHNIDELPLISSRVLKFDSAPLSGFSNITISKDDSLNSIIDKLYNGSQV